MKLGLVMTWRGIDDYLPEGWKGLISLSWLPEGWIFMYDIKWIAWASGLVNLQKRKGLLIIHLVNHLLGSS